MELTELLDVLDRTAANVEKLEKVWARARPSRGLSRDGVNKLVSLN